MRPRRPVVHRGIRNILLRLVCDEQHTGRSHVGADLELQRKHFADDPPTPTFSERRRSTDADVQPTPTFSRRRGSTDAEVQPTPTFSRRRGSTDADVQPTLTFDRRRGSTDADDVEGAEGVELGDASSDSS